MVVCSIAAIGSGCGGETEPVTGTTTTGAPAALPVDDVELVRDDLGITHVIAKNDADALFGQGYAMARDRLFDMELNRRRALGTRAAVLGADAVGDDVSARTMNFAGLGELDEELLRQEHPGDLALLEAWVAGVNRRIEEIEKGEAPVPYGLRVTELDLVPERWTAAHALAIGKTLAFGLSNTLDYDILATAIMRLAPEAAKVIPLGMPAFDAAILEDAPQAPPPAPPGPSLASLGPAVKHEGPLSFKPMFPRLGSNNWAIDAAHSENGRPLLAGDPHQPLTSPSRLWPTHVSSAEGGGSLDVIGFAFVGTPGVQLGHNARVGWTATTNYADVMDLWDVSVDGDTVSLGGEAHAIVVRKETIAVKGGDDVVVEVREVPGFGVILPEEILPVPLALLADGDLLFNWIGFGGTNEASAYMAIDRSANVDEFDAAVDLLDVGAVNFVAADAEDITYRVHTHVPDRGDPASRPMPWHVVSGDDPESFWTGEFLPEELLPKMRSPAKGYISSANNDPFGFTFDGSPENDPFYYGGVYGVGFRAHRIQELIEAKLATGKVGREDMEEMQRDTRQPMVDTIVPRLSAAIEEVGKDAKLAEFEGRADLVELSERLSAWDGRFTEESDEAVIFFALQWFTAKRVFAAKLTSVLFYGIADESQPYFIGQLRNVLEGRFPGAAELLPNGPEVVLLGALDDTSQWLKGRFGSLASPFEWRDVHAAELRTPFGGELVVPKIRRAGAIDTVNVSDCSFFDGNGGARDELVSHDGSVYRMVVEFDEEGRARATINFSHGVSGEPGDPHFDDQNERWAKVEYTPLPFAKADVEARAESRVTLPAR